MCTCLGDTAKQRPTANHSFQFYGLYWIFRRLRFVFGHPERSCSRLNFISNEDDRSSYVELSSASI